MTVLPSSGSAASDLTNDATPAADSDGDGRYEHVDGDGAFDVLDEDMGVRRRRRVLPR